MYGCNRPVSRCAERMPGKRGVVHVWFNLSDPGAEEALYDSSSMRRFAGIDLGAMPVPDESTVLRFRHLLGTRSGGENGMMIEVDIAPSTSVCYTSRRVSLRGGHP
jgi:hypothetical protein